MLVRPLFVTCCACLISVSTHAQPVSTEEEERALSQIYGTEDMVSIASGYKQPISKAPSIATVITADDIKQIGATDIDEALESVPGLHVERNTIGYNPIYTFRGIYSQFNQQVLMMINGIPISNSYTGSRSEVWGGMPIRDIARIEIVRGPGSAVYGADAFAGVINVITKTKQDIEGTEVGGRVGSFDTYDGWALHGGEWAGFDVALAFEYHKTAGQNAMVDADLQSQFDSLLGTRASLAPGPLNMSRDNLDARLDLSRGHWRFRGGLQHRSDFGNGSGIAQALDPVNRYASDRWNADVTYHNADIENWDLTTQASYFETSQEIERNLTLFPAGTTLPIGANGQIGAGAPVTFPNGYIGNPEVWERHVRISQTFAYGGFQGHQLRSGIGFNYDSLFKARVSQNFGIDPATGAPIPSLPGIPLTDVSGTSATFIPEVDRKVAYLFLQDQWNFANDWSLTAGARYDRYSDFGNTFNPRAALIWEARYDLTAKLMYGSAFRAPSFQEMYIINNPAQLGNAALRPETMENVELGFDYRPTDSLRLGLNFFNFWWKDIIRFVPDANATTSTAQNTGVQQGYGTELEAEWQAADTLKIIGNYAYQRSRDQALDRDSGYAPHHQIYLRLNWEFLPDWQLSPQAKWIVGRDRSFGDTRKPVADYTWVDVTLRRQNLAKHLEVAFSVRNLFDVSAREPSLAGNPAAIPNDLPLAPRSFYGEISLHF
ncbi:TonB-dependent receptor [Methylomonas sp. LW13]|uniref:TonB-dependent receptor n=1 Tax=Methylomonas defluvii TaxID=3045149 RepID=A0ABU4UHV7_9GAMM|nr:MULTISPECIES: TonB-dependent receptor [unclassified Methylomonas]MDX8128786.1 TonB-dependent receptor [Methylomonas sp. OY6]QBC28514.1 TonB-dependent receptor [Methylomonas sp. LW13]